MQFSPNCSQKTPNSSPIRGRDKGCLCEFKVWYISCISHSHALCFCDMCAKLWPDLMISFIQEQDDFL